MLCIGIDCRFACEHAGLGTYTRGIVRALLSRNDDVSYVLFVRSRTEAWLASPPTTTAFRVVEAPFRHYSFSEQCRFPKIVARSGCELLFVPHFNVPLFCPVPFVTTIHDLILHRYPNETGFLKRLAYRFVLGSTLRRARSVIAVSEYTKNDVLKSYPNVAGKISVASPGIDAIFQRASDSVIASVRKKYALPDRFLLYVGNCKAHKNVPVLLKAFAEAELPETDLVLVCAGRQCDALSLPARAHRIAGVDAADFPALYSAASGLVTATLDEGFGLPMVEAMACETPVLATRCGSIPEVCGEHALIVEPTVEALAEGMKNIVIDGELRSSSRLNAAKEWAKRYDWTKTAVTVETLFQKHFHA